MEFKYGLKPVQFQPRVMLRDFYTPALPSVDSLTFPVAHADAIEPHMFLNDEIGDCAIAGRIEEIRLANALRGVTVNFTDAEAARNYSDITGYSPADPSTDGGTDVHELYEYSRDTGFIDADGQRHKIVAYAGLTPGDFDEMLLALSLFDMVGIGIRVPDYAESQFEAGQPWDLLPGRCTIKGGHYIPVVGARSRSVADVLTWGRKTGMTARFYAAFNLVAVVALTEELFTEGKSPEGVDRDKLGEQLGLFNTGPVMAKAPKPAKAAPVDLGTQELTVTNAEIEGPLQAIEIGDGKTEESAA
jgi:hypothetical protein